MAGIYLHIPFCRKACSYCDFHFSTNLLRREEMGEALLEEMQLRRGYFPEGTRLETIYFGGGTPSLLPAASLGRIVDGIGAKWESRADREVTLEANPDDIDAATLRAWRDIGINRLSIGVQSFSDTDLKLLNRTHTGQQSDRAVKLAQDMGFENITVDLIYGIPGSGKQVWEDNVSQVIALQVPHVSAYALTVEEKTLLHHQVAKGLLDLEPDSVHVHQYFHLIDRLGDAGIVQYELSNFAREGYRSRHNGAYWKGKSYLGLGPSAHSYDGMRRSYNVANNAAYLRAVAERRLAVEQVEELSERDRYNEYVMTQLRIVDGLDLAFVKAQWGKDLMEEHGEEIEEWRQRGYLVLSPGRMQLSREGFMVSDGIIRELFWVD